MGVTWLSTAAQSRGGYRPRHRSARQNADYDSGLTGWQGRPPHVHWDMAGRAPAGGDGGFAYQAPESASLDRLTVGELRRILEGCALDELSRVVPELIQLVAHSSHTRATLAEAWNEFEEATRDAYALQLHMRDWSEFFSHDELGAHPDDAAVAIKLTDADEAWRQIVCGVPGTVHEAHR
jgi:hypothetical protein